MLVVGKGSSEHIADIARGFDVKLIADEQDLEYRAAVETGLARASGDLLAVLDADAAPDPRYLGPLCRMLAGSQADIAVAALPEGVNAMRVMRRATVQRLHDLPDAVDFMSPVSSITQLQPGLTVVHVPLGYAEPQPNVVGDGVRALPDMALTALSQRPLRVLGTPGVALLLFALGYGLYPAVHYLRERRIEEGMFYRLSAVAFAITAGCNLILAGLLAQQSVAVPDRKPDSLRLVVDRVMSTHLPVYGLLCLAVGSVLNAPALRHYLTSGQIGPYWSHMLAGGLLVVLGFQFISFSILARALRRPMPERRLAGWPEASGSLP